MNEQPFYIKKELIDKLVSWELQKPKIERKGRFLPVVYIDKPVVLQIDSYKKTYPAKSVAVLPVDSLSKDEIQGLIDKKYIAIYDAAEFFSSYNVSEGRAPLFTHLGGGIGDMIAFSSLTAYFPGYPIRLFVDPKMYPIFKWFEVEPALKPFNEVIVENLTFGNRITKLRVMRRLQLEYSTVDCKGGNWYDGMYQRIGLEAAPEGFNRPKLKTYRVSQLPHQLDRHTILLCPRSSCQIRSSSLEDFYKPIRAAFPRTKIAIHEADLSPQDLEYIKYRKNIQIIPECSIEQYLVNLYDASLVISTDSSAIHFREGVGRLAIGAFGAMTTNSRTAGYQWAQCFNVQSGCQYQPCFVHELKKGQTCPGYKPDSPLIAPCLTGEAFQEQLYNFIHDLGLD